MRHSRLGKPGEMRRDGGKASNGFFLFPQPPKELCRQRGPAGLPWELLLIGKGSYWGTKDRRRHHESFLPHIFPPSAWDPLQGRHPQSCPGFWRAGEGTGIDLVRWGPVSVPWQTVGEGLAQSDSPKGLAQVIPTQRLSHQGGKWTRTGWVTHLYGLF